MAEIDASRHDFVVSLQQDGPVTKVVEERVDRWLYVEGVEPEREDAGFALSFGVKVLDLQFFFFGDGVQTGVGVEKVGNEGEVEFWVASDEGSRGEEFAAI